MARNATIKIDDAHALNKVTHKYNQKLVMSKCMNCLMVYDLKENYTDQI